MLVLSPFRKRPAGAGLCHVLGTRRMAAILVFDRFSVALSWLCPRDDLPVRHSAIVRRFWHWPSAGAQRRADRRDVPPLSERWFFRCAAAQPSSNRPGAA